MSHRMARAIHEAVADLGADHIDPEVRRLAHELLVRIDNLIGGTLDGWVCPAMPFGHNWQADTGPFPTWLGAPGLAWQNDEAPGRWVVDQDQPSLPGASRACLPVRTGPVHFRTAAAAAGADCSPATDRYPLASTHLRSAGVDGPGLPALRSYLRPTRGRVRRRPGHRPPLRHRGRGRSGRPRPHPPAGHGGCPASTASTV